MNTQICCQQPAEGRTKYSMLCSPFECNTPIFYLDLKTSTGPMNYRSQVQLLTAGKKIHTCLQFYLIHHIHFLFEAQAKSAVSLLLKSLGYMCYDNKSKDILHRAPLLSVHKISCIFQINTILLFPHCSLCGQWNFSAPMLFLHVC